MANVNIYIYLNNLNEWMSVHSLYTLFFLKKITFLFFANDL